MAFKIYKKNNYIIVEDTVAGKQYQGLAKNVFVYKDTIAESTYDFEGLTYNGLKGISLSDIVDETNTPFINEQAFIDFYTVNTGNFNSGGATSLTTDEENAIQGANSPSATNVFATIDDITNASSTFKTLPADVTTTLATAQAITPLTQALEVNSTYIVRGNLRLGCSGSGGVKLAVTYPTSTIAVIQAIGQGANINSSTWVNHSNASSGVLQNAVSTSNTVAATYIMNGTIKTGGTAGNLVFSFASTTAGQTSNVYTDGSFVEIIKIS